MTEKREVMRRNTSAVSFRDVTLENWLAEQAEAGESLGSVSKRLLWRLHGAEALSRNPERDLERIDSLTRRAWALWQRGEHALTVGEMTVLIDVSNSTMWIPESIPHLAHGVKDAMRLESVHTQHGVDGPALLEKLDRMDLMTLLAVVEACEAFWDAVTAGPEREFSDVLEEVAPLLRGRA